MSLFSITCTTCKSRLSVRDAGAIGQILACPKCGGMVMVRPPADWQETPDASVPAAVASPSAALRPAAPQSAAPKTAATPPTAQQPPRPPADDQTATDIPPPGSAARRDAQATLSDSHFDAVDDLLSNAPPRVPQSAIPPAHAHQAHAPPAHAANPHAADPASVHRNRFSGGALPAPTKAATAEHAPPPVGHPSSQADATEPEPVDFEEAIAASRVRPRSYWLVISGSVVAGMALAVAVVVAASNYFADRTPSGPIAKAGGGGPATPTHPADSNNTGASPANSGEPTTPNTAPPADPPENPDNHPADPDATPPVEPTRPPSDTPPTGPASDTPPSDTPPATDPPADPATATPAPPRPLSPFDRLLENDPDPLARPTDPLSPAAPGDAAPPDPAEATRPALPRPPERAVDLAARLADPLPLIEAADTPLVDFLAVLADFSTIPITLDPDGLPLVQARATSPINFKLQSTTVGQALRTGIAAYKLAVVEEGNQLRVTLAEPPTMRKLNYPLAGLAETEVEAEYLANLLRSLIAPDSWQPLAGVGDIESANPDAANPDAPDAGAASTTDDSRDTDKAPAPRGTIDVAADKLAIQQSMAVHARVFFLLERLRTARGQRHLPYAAKFDPVWLSLATRSEQAAPKLAASVTANFGYGAQLGTILKHLESAAGVRILVDWRALAAAGWNPDGEVPFTADAESLSTALTRLAQSMDLDWRAIDADTLELTTTEALAARPDLEFYEVKDLAADEAAGQSLVSQFQSDLGSTLFANAGGPYHLHYDPQSRCLIATLPQAKQRELAEKLGALRGK
jgi:hypothetical protein